MSKLLSLAEKEVLRREIMKLCSEAEPAGCSKDVLAAAFAYGATERTDLERQIEYLEGKGLVSCRKIGNKRLGLEKEIVKITSEGTDFLEGSGEGIIGIGE